VSILCLAIPTNIFRITKSPDPSLFTVKMTTNNSRSHIPHDRTFIDSRAEKESLLTPDEEDLNPKPIFKLRLHLIICFRLLALCYLCFATPILSWSNMVVAAVFAWIGLIRNFQVLLYQVLMRRVTHSPTHVEVTGLESLKPEQILTGLTLEMFPGYDRGASGYYSIHYIDVLSNS
jgi:hypothetical protein